MFKTGDVVQYLGSRVAYKEEAALNSRACYTVTHSTVSTFTVSCWTLQQGDPMWNLTKLCPFVIGDVVACGHLRGRVLDVDGPRFKLVSGWYLAGNTWDLSLDVLAGDWVTVTGIPYLVAAVKGNTVKLRTTATYTTDFVPLDKFSKVTDHKHWAVMQTWAKGSQVECRKFLESNWLEEPSPLWTEEFDYRVKPKVTTKRYSLGNIVSDNIEATFENDVLIAVKLI